MEFYELRNFARNKVDKIYDESKFAVLDEMGERRYVVELQVSGEDMSLIVPTTPNDYDDGIFVEELMNAIDSLEAEDFDGDVYAIEDDSFGREAAVEHVYVDEDDYVVIFEASI